MSVYEIWNDPQNRLFNKEETARTALKELCLAYSTLNFGVSLMVDGDVHNRIKDPVLAAERHVLNGKGIDINDFRNKKEFTVGISLRQVE